MYQTMSEVKVIRQLFLLFAALLVFSSCADNEIVYRLGCSSPLKDNSVLNFDLELTLADQAGFAEVKSKREKLRLGARIIMVHRYPNQINGSMRIRTVMRKIINSQIDAEVIRVSVKNINIRKSSNG